MRLLKMLMLVTCLSAAHGRAASEVNQPKLRQAVDKIIKPVMQSHGIPGMAVAVTVDGKSRLYHYGVASRKTGQPVTGKTLFEIGSISKTFTATLASYAQLDGKLAWSDSPGKYLPSLQGSSLDDFTLLHLATHTAGGLPLQVPDTINNTDQLLHHFKARQPAYPAGTQRTYSNVGIGMLGMIAAKSMQQPFDVALERTLFRELGMTNSFINVPAERMNNYAQGYTRQDAPIRLNPGVLAAEAYAVKSSSVDMIRFVEANMQVARSDGKLQRAIAQTHQGYFKSGETIQGLIWEYYPLPTTLDTVLAGNSAAMIYASTMATRFNPPLPPRPDVLINKTGSTNGFAAYVAFIPAQKTGIVMLANKNYPVEARVAAAYRILTALVGKATKAEH